MGNSHLRPPVGSMRYLYPKWTGQSGACCIAPAPSRSPQGRQRFSFLPPKHCCRRRFHPLRPAFIPQEGIPVGPEGFVPHSAPLQAQPVLDRVKRRCWTLGPPFFWRQTQPHTYLDIGSTAAIHHKPVLWIGEGMKSSPASWFEYPQACQ